MDISKNNTVFILDWDDTLFPTTWITKNNIDVSVSYDIHYHLQHFRKLDKNLYSLLNKMIGMGNILIITNATTDWVEFTSKLLPQSRSIIKKINIISARKHQLTTTMENWKKVTFHESVGNKIKYSELINIISIGDAEYEYNALISLHKCKNDHYKLLKSIKFKKNPTFDELLDQMCILHGMLDSIYKKHAHLDLKFVPH